MLLPTLFCGDLLCYVVEKNPAPKSQTKPFYIGTKEAPSDSVVINPYYIVLFASITLRANIMTESRHEKTGFSHMRKQRRGPAV